MIIGYIFTFVYAALLIGLLVSAFLLRKTISRKLREDITPTYALLALLIVAFFVIFSIHYVAPVEQLYFDENIYQGIALNILHSGNALWCQYGSALLTSCPYSVVYHDPVEISFYLAIAFAIFGVGIATAYAMSLFIGALSILLVFLLGSSLFDRRTGLASAIVFALIPEVFIWSRTQAIPDLLFMMFAILAVYAYEIYRNNKSTASLAFFLFALGITVYVRIEAMLLVPIFILLVAYESVVANGVKKGIGKLFGGGNIKKLAVVALFFILIMPEIYYIFYEGQSPNYGSGSLCGINTNSTFSLSNFKCNIVSNTNFFVGAYNSVSYYPAYFALLTTVIAIIGAGVMLFKGGKKGIPILLLGLWIVVFHLFYDVFYAGSVTFGVDSRFMLIIYPAMAIFAGFGIATLSILIPKAAGIFSRRKDEVKKRWLSSLLFVGLLIVFAALPFYNSLSITAISPLKMPQEAVPMAATNFIYQNVKSIPANCLVFTFTPDVWWEQNRSAAQVGFFDSTDANFTKFESSFTCFVYDSGYWCNTPEYRTGTCEADLNDYNRTLIVSQPSPNNNGNFSLYYVDGYKS